MKFYNLCFCVAVVSLCLVAHSSTSDANGTISNSTMDSEEKSDDDDVVVEAGEVVTDTGDLTPEDVSELTPEDEDMETLKIEELGGLIDAKDMVDDEEQTIEDMEVEDIPEDKQDLRFEPIPMPTDFDSYDRNGDGFIDITELIEVTGAFENVAQAFKACDSDGNERIDRTEFRDAPWDLSGKPPEVVIEDIN
ncbi:coiled-coil domain-containing protein 1-like [Haliotis rufescens]|uniref:coiled-coil domain-containing protein 1-like n=1 Tax=Haliotis rufescens TaxID=6454 RepID=UPI00201F8F7A|nr:coiled-coil domain-containing protein 1-like [Haliotis rufescens]